MATVSEVARIHGVDQYRVKTWTTELAEQLSLSANPPKGTVRKFGETDVPGGVETTPVVGTIYRINADGSGLKELVQLGKNTDYPTFMVSSRRCMSSCV